MTEDLKGYIKREIYDVAHDFIHYNRKFDEKLSSDHILASIYSGDITVDELGEMFKESLNEVMKLEKIEPF
jgi:hypothetical protein